MSKFHCCLCASDEGILLDIFADNGDKNFSVKLETCLSVKIKDSDVQSTKICHKCAYELDACSQFVQKYKQSRSGQETTINSSKGHCCLCFEPGKRGYIFELNEEKCLNKSLVKIQELFNDNLINDHSQSLSICLNCHYNLDVLFDLKKIYQSTLNKLETVYEEGKNQKVFPKTKTYVVNRKTTYIPVPQINDLVKSDTDSNKSIMPLKRRRGRPRKKPVQDTNFRICGECQTCVENGIDMYRYHHTGITVCKDCWLTMDPTKVTNNKRKKVEHTDAETSTKLCAVFLKDVLANPKASNTELKGEIDEGANSIALNIDDTSDSDQKLKNGGIRLRTRKDSAVSVDAPIADKKKPIKRNASEKKSESDYEPPKKTRMLRSRPSADEPSTSTRQKTALLSKTRRANGHNASEKEAPTSKIVKQKSVELPAKGDTTEESVSVSDVEIPKVSEQTLNTRTRSRKKITDEKSVTEDTTTKETKISSPPKTRKITKKIVVEEKLEKVVLPNEETEVRAKEEKEVPAKEEKEIRAKEEKEVRAKEEKEVRAKEEKEVRAKDEKEVLAKEEKEVRPGRKTRASSYTSEENLLKNRSTMSRRATKSVSTSPQSKHTISTIKTPKKKSKSDSELEQPYNCKVCFILCKNKLDGKAHELTHEKQPEVKLRRIAIPEALVEEATVQTTDEEPEQQSHDVSSTSDAPVERPETLKSSAENSTVADNPATEIINHKEDTDEIDKLPVVVDDTSTEIHKKDDDVSKDDQSKNEDKSEENISNENKPDDSILKENKTDESKPDENCPEENKSEEIKLEDSQSDVNQSQEKQREEDKSEEMKLEESKPEEAKNAVVEDDQPNDKSNSVEKVCDDEVKEIPIAPDSEIITNEKKTEETAADTTDKSESAYSKNDRKEEHVVKSPIQTTEESAELSTEVSVNGNGIEDENDSNSETNKVDKDGIEKEGDVESETEIRIIDTESPEGSPVQSESVPEASSVVPEKKTEDIDNEVKKIKDAEEKDDEEKNAEVKNNEVKDVEVKHDETGDMAKRTEEESSTKCLVVEETEKSTVAEESESMTVVTEVLKEVFDLATAEIQKRLEAAVPEDGKSTTPVSETLENISREIRNSADMPSLEPIVDDPSANNRS